MALSHKESADTLRALVTLTMSSDMQTTSDEAGGEMLWTALGTDVQRGVGTVPLLRNIAADTAVPDLAHDIAACADGIEAMLGVLLEAVVTIRDMYVTTYRTMTGGTTEAAIEAWPSLAERIIDGTDG